MDTSKIEKTLYQIAELLQKLKDNQREFLNFNQARDFLGVGTSTLYKLTSERKIKYYKPNGKLLFKKGDLEKWITQNPMRTLEEEKLLRNKKAKREINV